MKSATLGIVTSRACLKHRAGVGHPERPERLEGVFDALRRAGLTPRGSTLDARPAEEEELAACHAAQHIDLVRRSCEQEEPLDGDTGVVKASWDAARLAAGAGLVAADAVMSGRCRRAFCAVRPPGHHATRNAAMGFCLFNNAAVTARYLQRRHGLSRVAILDFDVHHGNGTQDIFYEDGGVLYGSTHQFGPDPLNPSVPFFPGTGSESETGRGAGEAATVNVPLPAGTGYDLVRWAFEEHLGGKLRSHRPEAIIVSAGFDAHRLDPLALLALETEDFGDLARVLIAQAESLCQGRIISILEGGYHLQALAESAVAHVQALAEPPSRSADGG